MSVTTSSGAPQVFVSRLSVPQYHEMIDRGILTKDDRVELLEGRLVEKMPINPSHRAAVKLTYDTLARLVPAGWYVDAQSPVTLTESEPEPDVTVVRGNTRQYLKQHPSPAEVALLVEVSDSTLERDRGLKQRLYAQAGIRVYWIINLIENQLEVYTAPSGPTETPDYGQRRDYALTEAVPLVIEEREIALVPVRELFP
jgi:Uma2 family endonuclease